MHPPRLRGFSYEGFHRYFLTLCTPGRSRLLTPDHVVSNVLEHFRQSASREGFAIVAYCFMPDHLHLLCIAQSASARLRRFVTNAKQKSGHWYSTSVGGRLWQPSFYDHVLRDEDETLTVVRYIFGNPVRAGLSGAIGEYPHCGSDQFTNEEIGECLQMWSSPAVNPACKRHTNRSWQP